MTANGTIQAANDTFAEHLETIILRNISLKDDFRRRVGGISLSNARLELMKKFASANLADDLRRKSDINWWHVFTDPFKQTLLPLRVNIPAIQEDSLSSVIIFTNWNIQNYKLICNISTDDIMPPQYPARKEDIPDTPTLLAYLEYEMIPVLKKHLQASMNIPFPYIEGRLAEKAVLYELEHTPGIDTMSPISRAEWQLSLGS